MSITHVRVFAFTYLSIFLLVCLALTPLLASAQDEPPAPQFLYRDDNHLVLVNGYTGETNPLPFEVGKDDRFEWSPDGKYLVYQQRNDQFGNYCLNLYEVDAEAWISQEPLSCNVRETLLSSDSRQLVYATVDGNNGVLWLYNIAHGASKELYRTADGQEALPEGVSDLHWSLTEKYLTFVSYSAILGGTLNGFVVMNFSTGDYITIQAPNPYYADYDPIWSADENWFLIMLKEQYVTSGTIPLSNHKGDVYLVNTQTGDLHRLTYTPAIFEGSLHWTDDGKIAFSVVKVQEITYTTEEAMQIEAVPQDQIVMPEPVDPDEFIQSLQIGGRILSPDSRVSAWVNYSSSSQNYLLNIGYFYSNDTVFTGDIPASYEEDRVLIGWRPSDYPYPLG